ncbi:MAG: bifunctional phosphoserine phosphatase/homoserine phosphotransferase ThrH [Treponema sp.]|nr:bifunctional phosphoserine phosphatase/homoserine phosphotransferase ThrH [Treponema sp.]
MFVTCLDLEGVLVPEIWIAFAEASRIPELRRTTRDEPDYDKLMKWRIALLKERGLGLKEIQKTIEKIEPLEGAKAFLDELRSISQVIILSDTFTEFAAPLMKKLGMPTIFCNNLTVDSNGMITGYNLRQSNGKYHAVKALQSIGFKTIAAGDSFNDLEMIKNSQAGFLFRPPKHIQDEYSHIKSFTEYSDFLAAIKAVIEAER